MTKFLSAACLIFTIGIAAPAPAQLLGDVNCNGFPWEIGDAVLMARLLFEHCDLYAPPCWENSDFDQDGQAPTIGDMIYMAHFDDPPNYPRHPRSDTLSVESAMAHPGETVILPVWISTMDTLMGLQFLLETDTEHIQFDSLADRDISPLLYSNCDGNIYCVTPFLVNNLIVDPGFYHICDLFFTINPDIAQPVTTPLSFSSDPPLALYSGLANADFFLPVFVDAEIEIVPLTDVESPDEITPSEFEISVYPNPFNDAVNIAVSSNSSAEIMVYDLLGRPVKTFAINSGNNLLRWDATDQSGKSLSVGIYFIGNRESQEFIKVLYLK